jgi:hypothetical protein
MARYFFDIIEDNRLYADDDGEECKDIEGAKSESARTLIEFARGKLSAFHAYKVFVQVRDEEGKPVLRAALLFEGEVLSGVEPVSFRHT